ncbi:MAG: CPBP family intramembrane glutamic endopeptidase [Thermoanaerobaculia bacterium]
MNGAAFLVLLIAGSAGILLSFAHARSRAVLAQDGFTHPGRRGLAMGLLAGVLLLTVAIPFAGGLAGARPETKDLSVASIFVTHGILVVFLVSYYLLSGRKSLGEFLYLKSSRPAADLGAGVLTGALGWVVMFATAYGVGFAWTVLRGKVPTPSVEDASSLIVWMVGRPLAVRIGIVLSAMVVEELFFRSFLQSRVGPVAATLMFTAAHGVYGEPFLLIGILAISAVLSIAFRVFGNVLPCIVAHGVFDALQMFVVIPTTLKALESGLVAAS